jgi:hypothetical protein
MHPVLGRVVIEREQLFLTVSDLRDGLGELRAVELPEVLDSLTGLALSSAFQISARAFFAPGCAGFGIAPRTFAILWNQQRCSLACGNTSRSAPQNPSAPSPAARTGARMPRRA